jgi:hypothetical protein
MKKLSDTLTELGIAFSFPIEIKDANGNETYSEDSSGYWIKWEYDANGNETYFEDSYGYWRKWEYDSNGNETYYEDSHGCKRGTPRSQSCAGKVIEVDGKKYQLKEL